LKFIAFLVVVGGLITSLSIGRNTEVGQRITGNREDRRVERTQLTPRFKYAAAKLRITVGSIYNAAGSTVDLTTTNGVSLDRESSMASSDINIERTSTEVAPGVNAIPFDALNAKYTQILTKSYRYASPREPGAPWTRSVVDPFYYGTQLDDHYIPMIDDIMGFELKDLPSKPASTDVAAGYKRPAVNNPTPSSDASNSYSYALDMQTYRRVVPILAARTLIEAPPDTAVTLTLAFDDVGLLRFADVSIASAVATALAQQRGSGRSSVYRYTFEVTDILGEPITIDLPTDSVSDAPQVILPGTVI
jgi:hypothetical protein